jgi:hypothetical protein
MIHGLIFSLENSKFFDFVQYSNLLFKCHIIQEWDQAVLKDIFASAFKKLFKSNQVINPTAAGPATSLDPHKHLFYHVEIHRGEFPCHKVRQIYSDSEECEATFKAELGIEQITLAYSCHKSYNTCDFCKFNPNGTPIIKNGGRGQTSTVQIRENAKGQILVR